jgi:eukaryotic-like serine/threonine-protein kinase
MSSPLDAPSIGSNVGNYQILDIIGAGGMGVVYRALDTRLNRTVALKFLPVAAANERETVRFLQEARAASALDHPNICTIYGIEESPDGRLFISMAYYEGETLAAKISHGRIPMAESIDYLVQIASGLSASHRANIVHRDVKPSNVLVTQQGILKLVDFGLARIISTTGATQSKEISGTVAYMSPEQMLGQPVDQRADIWPLGVIAVEMLLHQHPFRGDNPASLVYAVCHLAPSGLEEFPKSLRYVISRCLSKTPADRYQSCDELLVDLEAVRAEVGQGGPESERKPPSSARISDRSLRRSLHAASSGPFVPPQQRSATRRWLVAAAAVAVLVAGVLAIPQARERLIGIVYSTPVKHIAVLPLENVGNKPENAPLAEGLMDSLTSELSNLDAGQASLWVVPASLVRSRKVDDAASAARSLGATLVVAGSVDREGQETRLTLNLINTSNLRQIGSVQLSSANGDLASLESEALRRLARLMNVKAVPAGLDKSSENAVPAAYEQYLEGLSYLQRYDKPGALEMAVGKFHAAVGQDSRFALAYATLAEAYRLKYMVDKHPQWIDAALKNCAIATSLNPQLPGTFVTLGRIHEATGKHDLAVDEFQRALALDPRNADALTGLAHTYENAGRIRDAEAAYKKAIALRPDYWDGYNSLGLFYDNQRRFDEAIAEMKRAIQLTPDNAQAYSNLAAFYQDTGNPAHIPEAEAALRKSIELSPSYPAYVNLGYLDLQQRKYAESAAFTEQAIQLNDLDPVAWENLSLAYGWLNQNDKVQKAREHERQLVEEAVKASPGDPQLQGFLGVIYARVGRKSEATERMQSALAIAPADAQILADAAVAYEDIGNRASASQYLRQAIAKGQSVEELQLDPDLRALLAANHVQP